MYALKSQYFHLFFPEKSSDFSHAQKAEPAKRRAKKYPLPHRQGSILSLFSCENAHFCFNPCLSELNFDLRTSRDFLFTDSYLLAFLAYMVHWILPHFIFFAKVPFRRKFICHFLTHLL